MQAQMARALTPQPKPTTHDVTAAKKARRAEYQRQYRARLGDGARAKHKLEMREWRSRNLVKSNEQARAYRARNPDQVRSSNLKKIYGITLDQFNDLFLSQGSKCAICKGDASNGKNWHVDHCHQTGRIRGILCHPCNLMIGHAGDDVERLLLSVEYLK
jgi:hypothetical protein